MRIDGAKICCPENQKLGKMPCLFVPHDVSEPIRLIRLQAKQAEDFLQKNVGKEYGFWHYESPSTGHKIQNAMWYKTDASPNVNIFASMITPRLLKNPVYGDVLITGINQNTLWKLYTEELSAYSSWLILVREKTPDLPWSKTNKKEE
jgi:hypothetical protein